MTPDVFARAALTVSESFELSIIAKATLVLTLALVAMRCARRARASIRHVILASAFGALLVLPPVVLMLPPFPVPVSGATAGGVLSARQIDVEMHNDRRSMAVIDHVRPAASRPRDNSAGLLRSAWSGVGLLFLAPIVLALWRSTIFAVAAYPGYRARRSHVKSRRGPVSAAPSTCYSTLTC